ncbi:MAG TPA: SDR family oxidoreductase [Roseiflexaceae bacterium]|nr:SDR family oxidoreductase [Roseiflexaceae bacterium]
MSDTAQGTIEGAVALVTGANRGIGAAFVEGLLAAGARRVYAAARSPQALIEAARRDARIVSVQLDITDDASVRTATGQLPDLTLLVNNAGVSFPQHLLAASALDAARREMDVNYFGLLRVSQALAPALAANGGGAIINVLSILSRVPLPAVASYSASKAAALSLTQSLRAALRPQGTRVIAVMPGFVETDMTEGVEAAKISPAEVVRAALDAARTGEEDVYPGETASQVARQLLQDPKAVERVFAGMLRA